MSPTLAERIAKVDITEPRAKKELELCSIMLTPEQLENISSVRVGYELARSMYIEEILKKQDPAMYARITGTDKRVPIFNITDSAREFMAQTED